MATESFQFYRAAETERLVIFGQRSATILRPGNASHELFSRAVSTTSDFKHAVSLPLSSILPPGVQVLAIGEPDPPRHPAKKRCSRLHREGLLRRWCCRRMLRLPSRGEQTAAFRGPVGSQLFFGIGAQPLTPTNGKIGAL